MYHLFKAKPLEKRLARTNHRSKSRNKFARYNFIFLAPQVITAAIDVTDIETPVEAQRYFYSFFKLKMIFLRVQNKVNRLSELLGTTRTEFSKLARVLKKLKNDVDTLWEENAQQSQAWKILKLSCCSPKRRSFHVFVKSVVNKTQKVKKKTIIYFY